MLDLETPTILAVGRIVPQKALDILLRAFAAAQDSLDGWQIVVLGDGPEEEALVDLADELSIADRIDWRGHVADPYPYYRASTIFVLPSRYEGMPDALLEAMSCGMPVVVSDASTGPLEIVEHEVSGLVVACDDIEALATALKRLATDPGLRRDLGRAAAEHAKHFDPAQAPDTCTQVVDLPDRSAEKAEATRARQGPLAAFKVLASYLLKRQVWGYVLKPQIWPEIWRFLRRKTRVAIGIDVEDPNAIELNRQEAVGWCRAQCIGAGDAIQSLLRDWHWSDLEEIESGELRAASERVDSVPFRLGGASNMNLLYNLCEGMQAQRVLETGVANGWSSLAFLLSLKNRKDGKLFSVDLPYLKYHNDRWVGIAVPDKLRDRWQLFRMADREGLPRAIQAAESIDLAHYDSDKSPEGRAFAYPRIWQALRDGGVLVSDDIGDNTSFREFCEKIGVIPIVVQQGKKFQGVLVKPGRPNDE